MAVGIVALLFLAVPARGTAQEVLYGVNSLDDGLSVIDPVTGTVTFVGHLSPDDPTKQYATPIAMAVSPGQGTLYVWNNSDEGQTSSDYIHTGVLLTVDPCTGEATQISIANSEQEIGALALQPTTGNLFALGRLSWPNTTSFGLFGVDKETGSIWPLEGFALPPVAGAAFSADGSPYALELVPAQRVGIDPARLYHIAINYGTEGITATLLEWRYLDTLVGTIGSIAFAQDGTLIGSGFGGSEGNVLFTLNPTAGEISNIIPLTGNAPQGMGFAPACALPSLLIPDQVSDSFYTISKSYGFNPGLAHLTQSFVPSVSPLVAVDLRLIAGVNFPPGSAVTSIRIRSDSPDGPVLENSSVATVVEGPLASNTEVWVRFFFDAPLAVTPGETYYLEWDTPSNTVLS